MPETDLQEILQFLQNTDGFDFNSYNSDVLRERISIRVRLAGKGKYDSYLHRLENDEIEKKELLSSFTINVSEFFRNPLAFEILSDKVFPTLLKKPSGSQFRSLRIWSAGCSTGEEAYSLAIIFDELKNKLDYEGQVHIFATDIDAEALDIARIGIYSAERLRNVRFERFRNYFVRVSENNFRINPALRENLIFSSFDLMNPASHAPPESIYGGFDLVVCRNVLIYFNAEQQSFIFKKLVKSVKKEGYLMLGEAERPGREVFESLDREFDFCKIYKRV